MEIQTIAEEFYLLESGEQTQITKSTLQELLDSHDMVFVGTQTEQGIVQHLYINLREK